MIIRLETIENKRATIYSSSRLHDWELLCTCTLCHHFLSKSRWCWLMPWSHDGNVIQPPMTIVGKNSLQVNHFQKPLVLEVYRGLLSRVTHVGMPWWCYRTQLLGRLYKMIVLVIILIFDCKIIRMITRTIV